MLTNLKRLSVLELILALRAISIVTQLGLVLFVNLALGYELPWVPLFTIITIEVVFNGLCFWFYKLRATKGAKHIVIQLLADVVFLGCLLYFSGGATNAFVSLLLIPIAIAAVSLSYLRMLLVAVAAVGTYSLLLWAMPMHVMHGNMEGHFIGMWINFLFSALVVSVVVGQLAQMITQREATIARYREEQLKQERIMALGVASAQVTHDLATPLATINLLVEELQESDEHQPEVIEDLVKQVARCSENLHAFRQTTEQIKTNQKQRVSSEKLFKQIKHHCQLNYPQCKFQFLSECAETVIEADGALIPAIVNIIDNAVEANKHTDKNQINVSTSIVDETWRLAIKDFGKGFLAEQTSQLGAYPQASEQGLGISVLLSNASLERINGKLELANHSDGAQVNISIPIVEGAV
ncbi:HAMP domain-containing histidine kinase [Thalassotalea sp. M1531]|uniref:histidine kinase n=1 Tax=Thalassotalea algicola TaxID=2716224 RepID=A0A7Y0Q6R3_9GAMM|nr:HAMP domain-containing sensor histidine kinase [Thalassotalea algicola]NMP30245.1 HAMP domain-containing histidine kinase [Thalassotalea algicola]